jgi:hypothetical protein
MATAERSVAAAGPSLIANGPLFVVGGPHATRVSVAAAGVRNDRIAN